MDEKLEFWADNLIEASFEEPPTPPEKPGWKTELVRLFRERSSVDVLSAWTMVLFIAMTVFVLWAKDFTWVKFTWCLTAALLVLAVWHITAKWTINENRTQKSGPD